MTLTLNNTNTLTADNIVIRGTDLSLIYATKAEIGNNAQITANTDEIAVLNTKNLQNFNSINAITTDLTNNYQSNSELSSNFYNKTEIDTSLGNYYTSSQVDTLIAGAGGGGGYTDTEIDNFLADKANLSLFTGNVSFFPVIDLSRPSILHQGLTLKNSTVNIEPLTGVLFSNQFGAEADRDVAVFRNQTNYITLKGNKIMSNATVDDSVVDLELNPTGNVNITNDLSVSNLTADGINLTNNINVGGNIELTDTNTNIERYNNATKSNISMDFRTDQEALRLILGTSTDADTNTFIECNNATGGTTLFKPTYFKDTVNYENDTSNISNASGLTLYKDTTDASNVLTVKNAQGYITFNSFNINAYNTSNDSSSLLLLNTANGNGCYCLSLGIGAIAGGNKLNVAGNSNFGGLTAFQNTSTFNTNVHINSRGRIFQRADANNSLNVISTDEINFSLQSNRDADPTTGTIAIQLNDTNGITLNRATTNNLTFNSIGNIVGESDIISWGRFMFQNSSELKEVLDTQYKLFIRNGDASGDINLTVGLEASTPEIKLTDSNVNLLGHLDITHQTVSTSERVKIDNPDADGLIFLSINGANICEVSNTGLHVNGTATETSDERLKENIKEISSKTCYDIVKYIKPKEFNFKGKEEREIGFIAQDVPNSTMPKHWSKMVMKDSDDDYLRLNYIKMNVVLWSSVQELIKEVEDLKKEIKKLKKDNDDTSPEARDARDASPKPKAKAKTKAKPKAKSKN